jgi:sarcosine oxidase, subunit beta
VNAAGAWAAALGNVPIRPVRRQVLPTIGRGPLDEDLPLTAYMTDAFHFRVRSGRVLLLYPGGAQADDRTPLRVDPSWMDDVERFCRARVPGLSGVLMDRAGAWAGYYDMSPDEHAIIGRVGNIVYANGSSGHGVMHAPAIGQIVSEIILDGRSTSLDVSSLRPSRFADGDPVRSVEVF